MIQIGLVTGGMKADRLITNHFRLLNKLIREQSDKTYCEIVAQFCLVLCVSGEVKDFKFTGFDRLRINRKKKEIWLDYGIPKDFLNEKSETEIKSFLLEVLRDAIQLFIQRLTKEKTTFDETQMMADYEKVARLYMSNDLGS